MQAVLLRVQSQKQDWAEEAALTLVNKTSYFVPIALHSLKTPKIPRESAEIKIKTEQNKILEFLKPEDFVVLFDERGTLFKDSAQFSLKLKSWLESGKKRLVFIIGGAFGVGDEVRDRAQAKVSLSTLTMNHVLAQVVALEQIYRGLSILNNRPYHND